MGLLKNSYFLDLQEREAERERMELAKREQEYINSRRAQQQPAKATKPKHDGTRN